MGALIAFPGSFGHKRNLLASVIVFPYIFIGKVIYYILLLFFNIYGV